MHLALNLPAAAGPARSPGGTTARPTVDELVGKRYKESDTEIHKIMAQSHFPDPETKRQCSNFVKHLRIHRHLFVHTFVHLASCCRSGLSRLSEHAGVWKGWDSVRQLIHHNIIRTILLDSWSKTPCQLHKALYENKFQAIVDFDGKDLLCHLLYCGKKPELYELCKKSAAGDDYQHAKEIIELAWRHIDKVTEEAILRRLRSQIYRMARKSAYLPTALEIDRTTISDEQELGAGAYGIVTRATIEGRAVAIKKPKCTSRSKLELLASEAILWKTLQHKNIAPFLGVIAQGTSEMGLVSQFYRNGNVRNYMRGRNPREWPTLAERLGKDLAKGLEYIHSNDPPIIHGDLKADNVLVDDDGHARLGDFGQSHASTDSGKHLDSSRVGLADNPINWMAPELMRWSDNTKSTDKADIYAFGCILYEMLSGSIPFGDVPRERIVKDVLNGIRPSKPHSVAGNDPVWKVVELCWKGHPERRPSAAEAVNFFPSRRLRLPFRT